MKRAPQEEEENVEAVVEEVASEEPEAEEKEDLKLLTMTKNHITREKVRTKTVKKLKKARLSKVKERVTEDRDKRLMKTPIITDISMPQDLKTKELMSPVKPKYPLLSLKIKERSQQTQMILIRK